MKTFKQIHEAALSVAQQRLMALALQHKRGELEADKVTPEVEKLADSMSEKELEDFASTKHKGLPKKVDEARTSSYDNAATVAAVGALAGALKKAKDRFDPVKVNKARREREERKKEREQAQKEIEQRKRDRAKKRADDQREKEQRKRDRDRKKAQNRVNEGPFRGIGKMLMKRKLQKGMKRDDSEFEKIRKRPSGGSKGDDMEASIKSYQRKRSALDRLTKR